MTARSRCLSRRLLRLELAAGSHHVDMQPVRRVRRKQRSQGRPYTARAVGAEAIVVAARQALMVTPPGEITFQQVSHLAGIDNRLIRYYFGYMPDLLKAVAVQVTEELRSRFAAANLHSGSLRDNLRLRVSIFLDFFESNPNHNRLVLEYLFKTEGPARKAALDRFRNSIAELRDMLDKAGSGKPNLDARLIHVSMASLCEFLFSAKPLLTALFDEDVTAPAFRERYCDYVTDLILSSTSLKKS
jgi:AcrR family transcriptional regulator